VATGHEALHEEVSQLVGALKQKMEDVDKVSSDLQRTKAQCELLKNLLTDATAEKEIMYDAFNEELDGMFNDAHLPEAQAWDALTMDLRQAKDARNALTKENVKLRQELAECQLQRDQWAELLRTHGLIS